MKFGSQPNITLTPTDKDKSLKVGTKEASHSSSCLKSTKGSSNLCFRDPQLSWVLAIWPAVRHVSNCRNCPLGKQVPPSQLNSCRDSSWEVPTFFPSKTRSPNLTHSIIMHSRVPESRATRESCCWFLSTRGVEETPFHNDLVGSQCHRPTKRAETSAFLHASWIAGA